MSKGRAIPDCVRFNPERNSTMYAVTDDAGKLVGVHEVFLDQDAKEIGRKTTGSPERGHVKFPGSQPVKVFKGEPEDGMEIWISTGQEVWVDVSGLQDTLDVTDC